MTGPLIGTHNGTFHADEALAVYLLRMLPTYQDSPIVRTRDAQRLNSCHTVVDVGGEYAPDRNRYDHHQRSFDTAFPQRKTKLSSAGLVYLHFGKAIIAQRIGLKSGDAEVDLLWHKIYADFIEALDANDNGISVYDSKLTKGLQKRFVDGSITLSALVGDLNWQYDCPDPSQEQTAEDKRFAEASTLMGQVFGRKLDYYCKAWLPARTQVREAFAARRSHDQQGRIMLFEAGCPWKDHLYTAESDERCALAERVLFVLYPENAMPDCKWRVQAVSVSKDSFESRQPLPEAWRGLRDEELSDKTGVPGCVFVHAGGFIGGNVSRDGAMSMAKKALS